MRRDRHDPTHVAHLAATLLSTRHDAEPHHVRAAVASAIGILDEAHRQLTPEEPSDAAGETRVKPGNGVAGASDPAS